MWKKIVAYWIYILGWLAAKPFKQGKGPDTVHRIWYA